MTGRQHRHHHQLGEACIEGRYVAYRQLFSITVTNREFALPNLTIFICASKPGGFRQIWEGWQPCILGSGIPQGELL